MRMLSVHICMIIAAGFLAAPLLSVHAQFLEEVNTTSIKLSPQFPEPGSSVTAQLDAYASDTQGATIRWFIDGTEVADAQNTREVIFTAPDRGETLEVSAQVVLPNGETLRAARTVTPVRLDLVLEADTLVPLHYTGRPLPSPGSDMRAVAIVGVETNPNGLTYTWTYGNDVLHGGPLLGRDSVTFEAPRGGSEFLTVSVANRAGSTIARKTVEVRTTEPFVRFYVDNPLRGLARTAIQSPHTFVGEEMVVRAVPFFMDADIFEQTPSFEWEINGRSVDNPSDDPQRITLQRGEGTGQFRVEFNIRNINNLVQGGDGQFMVRF